MSMSPPTAIERAFELAKSGKCLSISDIRNQLKIEGYGPEQVTGPTLLRQLRKLIAAAGEKSTGA